MRHFVGLRGRRKKCRIIERLSLYIYGKNKEFDTAQLIDGLMIRLMMSTDKSDESWVGHVEMWGFGGGNLEVEFEFEFGDDVNFPVWPESDSLLMMIMLSTQWAKWRGTIILYLWYGWLECHDHGVTWCSWWRWWWECHTQLINLKIIKYIW